jgi:hypothetical protein
VHRGINTSVAADEVIVGLHGFSTTGRIHSVMNLDKLGKEKSLRYRVLSDHGLCVNIDCAQVYLSFASWLGLF